MTQDNGHSGELDFPTQLGKFRILKHIASGEVSEIFLAKMPGMAGFEREMVLKLFHPHLAQDPDFAQAIVEEAQTAVMLRHPNIVQVYNLEEQGDLKYFVMEHIPGLSLSAIQKIDAEQGVWIPLPTVLYVLLEVLEGLAYAHELTDQDGRPLHVVHGNLSPKNIMLTDDGVVKMINFGSAKTTAAVSQTAPGAYAAPEPRERSDHRADLFSLGVLLWEAVAEARLETPVQQGASKDWPPSVSKIRPGVPRALDRILRQTLALDPERRFASAREFKDALVKFVAPVTVDRLKSSLDLRSASVGDASAAAPSQSQEQSRDALTQALFSRRSASRIWLWSTLGVVFVVAVLAMASQWINASTRGGGGSKSEPASDAGVAPVAATQSVVDAGTSAEHPSKPEPGDGAVVVRPSADGPSDGADENAVPARKKDSAARKVAAKQRRLRRRPPAPIRLTRKDVAKVLRHHQVAFQRCAMDYFRKEGASRQLELVMEFTIGSDGRITVVKLVPATYESTTLGLCLLKHVEQLKFPQHRDKSVSISFPLKFQAVTE